MAPKLRSDEKKEEKTEFITRDEVKELLNIQRETIIACFRESVSTAVNSLAERVDRIANDVQDIKTSLNFTGDITDQKLNVINEQIDRLKTEIKSTQSNQGELINVTHGNKKKLVDLEDRSRRCNIRIDGVSENNNETWDKTKIKVKRLIKENLKVEQNVEIQRAHRIAPNEYQKKKNLPRTILCKLLCLSDKEKVLAKRGELRGSNLHINEDYSEETNRVRIELQLEAKKQRTDGKYAQVVYNRLIVRDRMENDQVNDRSTNESQVSDQQGG